MDYFIDVGVIEVEAVIVFAFFVSFAPCWVGDGVVVPGFHGVKVDDSFSGD